MASRRQSSRSNATSSKHKKTASTSSMKMFLIGCITGAVIVLTVQWLYQNKKASNGRPTATSASDAIEGKSEPIFDFYTRLQQVEVDVPDRIEPVGRGYSVYFIQAGSFKEKSSAENLRANLILLNLDAEISIHNQNGILWHSVLLGPYEKRTLAANAKTTLLENNIKSIILKRNIKE